MKKWQVLLVDDEQDVHSITGLILKKKRWRRIPFELTSAYSQAEAMEILQNQRDFHVALVDVVMEKDSSGLELCEYIRKHCPSSMRIVLRTGQPGLAPEENILNEYDIDYYLAKSDATPAKLYSVIRACLRSSVILVTSTPRASVITNDRADWAVSFTSATIAFLSSSPSATGSSPGLVWQQVARRLL